MGYDATPKGRVGYACMVFGSKIFVTGGYDSIFPSYKHADLWATSDFATWTEQNTSFFWDRQTLRMQLFLSVAICGFWVVPFPSRQLT